MNRRGRGAILLAAAALTAGCDSAADEEGVVARVGPYRLRVDQAVELLVDQENLAADAGVVRSLAELWVDYTLLAEAVANDSTLPGLDLEPLVMQQVSQQMVFQLRDSVIQVDTFITDAELRARYEAEEPALEVRARHIMMRPPLQATPAQIDSVEAVLEALRGRVLTGESFAELARDFSQDPGSSGSGGDLGYFGRGDMVAPFEEAALPLEPGEVSGVVRTPMGLHIIQVDDRRVRGFEEVAAQYRRQTQQRMVAEAESIFVAGLTDRADPQITEGATETLREVAANPGSRLAGRAERRPLIEWEGGEVTVADARLVLQLEPAQLREQVAEGTDEDLEGFLESLARRQILVRTAEAEALRPEQDSIEVLIENARMQLREAARRLGLTELDQAPGEELETAIERTVEESLRDVVAGATPIVPLGLVAFQLREGRSTAILDEGIGEVILGIVEIRSARQLAPVEGMPLDSAGADTGPEGG